MNHTLIVFIYLSCLKVACAKDIMATTESTGSLFATTLYDFNYPCKTCSINCDLLN